MTYQTLGDWLGEWHLAFRGAQANDEIRERIRPFGYDDARLDALLDQLADVERLDVACWNCLTEKESATQAYQDAFAALQTMFGRHCRLARLAVERGTSGYAVLGLSGRRERSFDGLVQQAASFYTALRERADLQERVAGLTVTPAAVDAAFEAIAAVRTAKNRQLAMVDAQKAAVRERDAAVRALRRETARFREVIDLTTADRPVLRVALGW